MYVVAKEVGCIGLGFRGRFISEHSVSVSARYRREVET